MWNSLVPDIQVSCIGLNRAIVCQYRSTNTGRQGDIHYIPFFRISDNTYLFQTTADTHRTQNNWLMVAGRHSFMFEVRACSDVVLILKDNEQKDDSIGDYIININRDNSAESYIEIWDPKGLTSTKGRIPLCIYVDLCLYTLPKFCLLFLLSNNFLY